MAPRRKASSVPEGKNHMHIGCTLDLTWWVCRR